PYTTLFRSRFKPPATFRELVQRCAQFLNLIATHSGYRRRYCRCCSRGFIPRGLRTLAAESVARTWQGQHACARRQGRFGLPILLGPILTDRKSTRLNSS